MASQEVDCDHGRQTESCSNCVFRDQEIVTIGYTYGSYYRTRKQLQVAGSWISVSMRGYQARVRLDPLDTNGGLFHAYCSSSCTKCW